MLMRNAKKKILLTSVTNSAKHIKRKKKCLVCKSGGSYRCGIISGGEDPIGGDKPTVDSVLGLVYVS